MSNNFAFAQSQQALHSILGNGTKQDTFNYLPLLSGDKFPEFELPKSAIITKQSDLENPFSLTAVSEFVRGSKPWVIAFLSITDKIERLEELESFQADIQVMGGSLIVLTNGHVQDFTRRIRNLQTINIYHDQDSLIAEKFGLFDTVNPLYDWISGIEHNIPLPAYYVISPDKEIVFHHVDYTLKTINGQIGDRPFVRNLLTSVYNVSQTGNISGYQKAVS